MKRRVLITGGAGFVGSHLTRACLRLGWQVAVVYQPEKGIDQIQDILPQIDAYPVMGKSGEVLDIVSKFRPELIFHLASVFIASHTKDEVATLVDANVAFGAQVLEATAQCKIPYLVNTGTSWQHFESNEYNPVNLYAATKQAFEDLLQYYVEATSLQAITLKLFDTYGPNDPRPKLFNLLEHTAQENTQLKMSPGDQLIDIVYIDDVTDAFIIAANRLFGGKVTSHETYAVSSDQSIRLRDLIDIYEDVTRYKIKIEWGGRPYREREVMVPWRGEERLPGWKPKISLERGILNCKSGRIVDKPAPMVTVCIPVFNCQEYIAQAIESVLGQTFSDFELLIIDNASTDGTLDVVASYTDPRIRLMRNKKNIGLEENWNKAVSEAQGTYIKLLPADDFLYPSCLEQQINIFESPENATVALAICARDIVDSIGEKVITRKFPGPERKMNGINAIRTIVRSGTNLLGEPAAILFKRALLQKTGVFDGTISYVIDVNLWLRMLLHGDLYILSMPHCAFRLSSGSTSLELATLQSKHFAMFIDQLTADSRFGIQWLDRQQGIWMSRLLGLARRLFYIFSVHK